VKGIRLIVILLLKKTKAHTIFHQAPFFDREPPFIYIIIKAFWGEGRKRNKVIHRE
jgi:hypothetical protein